MTNAYLLCRIADTIEDEPALSPVETQAFLQRFMAAVAGNGNPLTLVHELDERLSERTWPPNGNWSTRCSGSSTVTSSLTENQRVAILRCVELMCYGMPRFQSTASLRGLPRMTDLDDYCYYVAGVVGEMLTELFCEYSPQMARNRTAMQGFAVSFAEGLQLTNILKDVWEDRSRGACWLPQEVFSRHGVDLARLSAEPYDPRFAAGMRELVAVAHGHLRNALDYTLLIPSQEIGIRRFCLWAIGLAVLTLQKINQNPKFTAGVQVKVSRKAVAMTRILTDVTGRSDWMLRGLFAYAARGLPLTRVRGAQRPYSAPMPASYRTDPAVSSTPMDAEPEPALRRSFGGLGDMSRTAPETERPPGAGCRAARGYRFPFAGEEPPLTGAGPGGGGGARCLDRKTERTGLLAVRTRGRLHHSSRVHHDDALSG